MRENQEDTPPSSVNGDEITGMEEEGVIFLDEMDELQFDEEMEELELEEEAPTEPPVENAILVFDKHLGSVFCCDLHPEGKVAVTGGEDDKAFVWSVETGQVLMDCNGHRDSVIFVGFSFDGVYLATADMGGWILVWKCSLGNDAPWKVVFQYESDDLTWGQWHFGARVLICGSVNGDIYVFKIPSGATKILQGHNSRIECAKLFQDGVRLAAGYEDGAIKVWDLKTSAVVQSLPAGTHEMRVTAIDTHPENNLMASISSDGRVVLSTANNGKVVAQIATDIDLETVAFAPDPQLGYLALGTLNGVVTVWDVARQMIRHHCAKATDEDIAGVTKVIWEKTDVISGCLDGSVRIYEGRTGQRKAMLTGHRSEVLDLCLNNKTNIILTTSDDGTARIFKYEVNKETN